MRSVKTSTREERIIFAGTSADDSWELYHELEKKGFRSLYFGHVDGYPGNSVSTYQEAGASLALDHLVALGHQHIVFIVNEPMTLQSIRIRLAYIRRRIETTAMKHVTILDCKVSAWGDSFAAAYNKMEEAMNISPRPTAICPISGNGSWAALRYLTKHGISVPDDVSLFSFDDSPASKQIYPSLTALTSSPDIEKACLKLLWSDEPQVKKEVISPRLIARESTGPARNV